MSLQQGEPAVFWFDEAWVFFATGRLQLLPGEWRAAGPVIAGEVLEVRDEPVEAGR